MLCDKQMQPAAAAVTSVAVASDDCTAQILSSEADSDEDQAAVVKDGSRPVAASHEVLLHKALILS